MRLQQTQTRLWHLRTTLVRARRSTRLWSCSVVRARYASSAVHPGLDLHAIDQKWQKRWQEPPATGASNIQTPAKEKYYVLAMFPYPSGALHMGHLRNYAVADVLARFRHMQGHRVLHPMGWDAFGLPAENAAIERGVHPANWTRENTSRMKAQLLAMNGGMDWSREFMTCDSTFYKHTQRLFLLLHQHGLAYQDEALVNYDPVDKTVLANEQVDSNGCSWRSGAKVEQIKLRQWFLKITEFRQSLLNDLQLLSQDGRWPERVLAMQRHWLGRSEGASITFSVTHESGKGQPESQINVFTTRADTLFGVQYLAVSASHPLVVERLASNPDLAEFVRLLTAMSPDSKSGFKLPGIYATNPLSELSPGPGHLHNPLPIFVAPYVLDTYGAGAVMGVPGHDSRDFAFWTQNCPDIPIRRVIVPERGTVFEQSPGVSEPVTSLGYLSSECGSFEGLSSKEAMVKIIALLGDRSIAKQSETWRLRDWLISRQRYWGTPIPIIHCGSCGAVPVPEDQLPVELPQIDGNWFHGRSGNPLEAAEEWLKTPCPSCGSPAKRDTDTMDTFMDSSWYFFRFTDPHNANLLFESQKANAHMPVDIYIGGIEHAILHLLYARFIAKFLAKIGLWSKGNDSGVLGEPFKRLLSQGMVHGKTYSDPQTGRFLRPEELDTTDANNPRIIQTGGSPRISFEKMSKSKYNGVDPSEFIAQYGADVTRAHILFQAPVTEVLEWEETRIVGIQRWFQRIWRLVDCIETPVPTNIPTSPAIDFSDYTDKERSLHNALHDTIASITTSLSDTHALNTCISDLMQLTNYIMDGVESSEAGTNIRGSLVEQAIDVLLRLLAPFAPAFASECWERIVAVPPKHREHFGSQNLGSHPDIFTQPFPTVASFPHLKSSTQTCVVMENGRKRFNISIPIPSRDLAGVGLRAWILSRIQDTPEGKTWLEKKGLNWDRVIVVQGGKTVNFVKSHSG